MKAGSRQKHELHATQHNTRGQESARPSELETTHSHSETERGEQVSEPRNSRHECRDPNTTLQHETRHADERERMAQARTKPHAHVKTRHDGTVRALSQNP